MDYNDSFTFYRLMISIPIAEEIKVWRVDEDNSFRKVHERFQKKYVNKSQWYVNTALSEMSDSFPSPHGKQMDGVMICELAMNKLGEEGKSEGWYD